MSAVDPRGESEGRLQKAGCPRRTLADLGSRVAARGAGLLLVVERPATIERIFRQFLSRKNRPVLLSSSPGDRASLVPLAGAGIRVDLPATSAETVGLVVALAEAGGTLRCS